MTERKQDVAKWAGVALAIGAVVWRQAVLDTRQTNIMENNTKTAERQQVLMEKMDDRIRYLEQESGRVDERWKQVESMLTELRKNRS